MGVGKLRTGKIGIAATAAVLAAAAALFASSAPRAEAAYPEARNGDLIVSACTFSQCDLVTFEPDGSGRRQLTATPTLHETNPVFSPNGRLIAFSQGGAIWLMERDGSDRIRITTPPGGRFDGTPAFSPDGRRVVFSRCPSLGPCDLALVNADGSRLRSLTATSGFDERDPDFSPDGRLILFSRNDADFLNFDSDLFTIRPDGSRLRNLTSTPDPNAEQASAFSPDGARIAFVFDRGTGIQDVWAMDRDGSGRTNLTRHPTNSDTFAPAVSPNSRLVSYSTNIATASPEDEIHLVGIDGSPRPRRITFTAAVEENDSAWQYVYRCAGRRATIVGDDGPDRIRGTRRKDVIVANGGKDKIRGRGGKDRICAGPGKDKVSGGAGKDRLLGGKGRDRLAGGPGRDKCSGGRGRDRGSCERGRL